MRYVTQTDSPTFLVELLQSLVHLQEQQSVLKRIVVLVRPACVCVCVVDLKQESEAGYGNHALSELIITLYIMSLQECVCVCLSGNWRLCQISAAVQPIAEQGNHRDNITGFIVKKKLFHECL